MEIIGYKVIENTSASSLERDVTEKIHEGWQPLGGINTLKDGDYSYRYTQAMVKYE